MKYISILLFLCLSWTLSISAQDQENSGETFDEDVPDSVYFDLFGLERMRDGIINYSSYWDIVPNNITTNMVDPPYKFFMKQGYHAKPTFAKQFFFHAGDTIDILVNSYSAQFVLYCFKVDDPSSFSHSLTYTGVRPYTYNHFKKAVPSSGTYMAVLLAPEDCYCDINVLNKMNFSMQVYACDLLPFIQPANVECHDFSWNSTGDVELIVLKPKVIAYNDNYAGTGVVNWGTEARIGTTFSSSNTSIIVALPKNISSGYVSTDIYARCEKPYGHNNSGHFEGNSFYIQNGGFGITDFDDFLITYPWIPGDAEDGGTGSYNCHAWASGLWNDMVTPNLSYQEYNINNNDLPCYDQYYAEIGYTRTGATEANSVIDVYANVTEVGTIVSHSAIKNYSNGLSFGFGWESKNGGYERVMHSRYAFNGGGYGQLIAHYKPIPGFVRDSISYLQVTFSEDEFSYIESVVNSIPNTVRNRFDVCYKSVKEQYYAHCQVSNAYLSKLSEYKELLEMIHDNPSVLYIAYLKLSEGESIICQLISDVTYDDNKALWLEVKEELKHKGEHTITTTNGLLTAYAKGLIFIDRNKNLDGFSIDDDVYLSDDDNILTVTNQNGKITIHYFLQKDSKVTLRIDNQYGMNVALLHKGEILSEGIYEKSCTISKKGIFVVTFMRNSQKFTKKIVIN